LAFGQRRVLPILRQIAFGEGLWKFPVFAFFPLGTVFGSFGPWVVCTNVGGKFFVTVGFVLLHHFNKRITSDRTGRLEPPVTLRATETLKILALNPF
jgi:hypothetical protein